VPANFEAAFAKVKHLVVDFLANEKFYLSLVSRCDSPTSAEIKIVEQV
jgi:hypothetical protein